MRVVDLEVMLHHFYKPVPFPSAAPSYQDAHANLISDGLIEETLRSRVGNEHGDAKDLVTGRTYDTTEKGRVFVNALMSVPVPVQAWTMPIRDPGEKERR